jgi:hypothetical protein
MSINLPLDNQLPPTTGSELLNEIDSLFSQDVRIDVLHCIYSTPDNKWAGMKDFKDRLMTAIGQNGPVDGQDREYVLDIARRVNAKIISVIRAPTLSQYSSSQSGSGDFSKELPIE